MPHKLKKKLKRISINCNPISGNVGVFKIMVFEILNPIFFVLSLNVLNGKTLSKELFVTVGFFRASSAVFLITASADFPRTSERFNLNDNSESNL